MGMSYMQIIRRIVLPQAMRTAFPTLANSLIAMVKDTSLAANITVTEMFMVTRRIVARTYEPLILLYRGGTDLPAFLYCPYEASEPGREKAQCQRHGQEVMI